MLPTCTENQKPYKIAHASIVANLPGATGNTPAEACLNLAINNGSPGSIFYAGSTQNDCHWSYSSQVWPILQVCEPPTTTASTTPAESYDYAALGSFWAFGFTGVMLLYFSSHVIGLVVKAVREF
ncbi:hypothetical protein [Polaromonas sp. YR568]|uniref:hypothetical protein n=1 Tax=Polaromonas sp. YR568 TaxID=1855301 RepID=UPI003137F01E